jgi:aminoglycoside phosphotransferase (APT) family kinase protein
MSIEEETIAVRTGEEVDWAAVERVLRTHIAGLSADPLQVRQFPSGASNLTYLLRVGEWEGVLRRPPLGPVAPKAHDMKRESGLLQRIHPVFPLAPEPYFFCDDLSVMSVPFYVMERRHGVVINDTIPATVAFTPELGRRLSFTVIDTLLAIHAIDWQAAGLNDFGYPEGFLARQVKSWIERYHRARTDDIPQVEPLTSWLTEHVPLSPASTLIHNDFKLNNILLSRDNLSVAEAVLDWEMATIGDPLFDLAISLCYWVRPDDPETIRTVLPTVTVLPGFMERAELMEIYAQKSGRDLSSMHFYMAFAYFKLAVILQQIYIRWKRGQTQDERFASFGSRVHHLILYAVQVVERGRP